MADINQKILKIDIIIPSIRMDTEQLLSMLHMNIPANVELCYYVISDNTSLSSTDFMHRGFPVHVIVNSDNLGAPLSRNVGLDKGNGEYALFLDDDVKPSPDILHAYVFAIRKNPDALGYVGPTIFPAPVNSFTRGVHASDMLTFFDISLTREWVAWGTTSNLMVRRDRIKDVRFSSVFPKAGGGEDIDFCLRVINGNNKWFKSVPDAAVYHNWWKNANRSYTRFFRWAFGDSRLPNMYPKNRYYNFPNMIETLFLGIIILTGLSLTGLFSLNHTISWVALVVLSQFIVERIRVKIRHPDSTLRDALEATLIRLSNDLGKFIGSLRRRDNPCFFTRFDYFVTRESISFERKIAMFAFMLFFVSIVSILVIF